jgi:hypothetical protein
MQCRTHPTRPGINTCNQCGEWLCEGCTIERNGRIFCANCAKQEFATVAPKAGDTKATRRPLEWGILLFFTLCFPPGVNYMSMGLIKKGLFALTTFFGIIYLGIMFVQANLSAISVIFWFALPVMWLATAFDGFNIRRRIKEGENVKDDIDGVLHFIKRNKHVLGLALILVVIFALVGNLTPTFWFTRFVGRGFPVIVIGLVVYSLLRKSKKMD